MEYCEDPRAERSRGDPSRFSRVIGSKEKAKEDGCGEGREKREKREWIRPWEPATERSAGDVGESAFFLCLGNGWPAIVGRSGMGHGTALAQQPLGLGLSPISKVSEEDGLSFGFCLLYLRYITF